MATPLLTPLLRSRPPAIADTLDRNRVRQALAADPALAGRAAYDDGGAVILTGPAAGPPPASAKERRRWELHVRLRIAVELGERLGAGLPIRWGGSGADIGMGPV